MKPINPMIKNGRPVQIKEYITDVITLEAIKQIEKFSKSDTLEE